jgi:hypothetical protein
MTLFVIEAGKCHDDCFFHALQKNVPSVLNQQTHFKLLLKKLSVLSQASFDSSLIT